MNMYTKPPSDLIRAMLRKASFFAAAFLPIASQSGAQTTNSDKVHIGFLYPISTHGTNAPADTNVFSFNVLGGVSAEERSFTFAGLSTIVRHNASGLQFAGFSNHIGGRSEGLLFAGFVNTYAQGKGLQFAGFSNMARKEIQGAQFSGFLNTAANVTGAQFGGFANVSKNMTGTQFAGFSNVAAKVQGTQFAGFINKAGDINGSQLAGFINVAKKVKGGQFAGFINIADSSDYPVGLINIIKNGEKAVSLSTDDNLTTLLSFRSGGKKLYGILGGGYNFNNSNEVYAFEAGFGAHINVVKPFRINTELSATTLQDFKDGTYFKSSLRFLPAFRPAKDIELFAGPVFNFVQTNTAEGKSLTKHYIYTVKNSSYSTYLRAFYIGYMGGVSFLF